MNMSERIKRLEATVKEQEATILHLRTANSVLSAKLLQKSRRKPKPMQKPTSTWVPGQYGADPVQTTKRKPQPKRTTVRDGHGVLRGLTAPERAAVLCQIRKGTTPSKGLRTRDHRGVLKGAQHG
jgi:hypothetical protein